MSSSATAAVPVGSPRSTACPSPSRRERHSAWWASPAAASRASRAGSSASSRSRAARSSSTARTSRPIARALAIKPDVIINDEVTSSLDVSVQATILNLLKDIQRELKLSYLFISHDLSSVRYMSDVVSVMYLGRVVETAETNQLFRSSAHPYTQVLIQSIPKFGEQRRKAPISGDLPDPRDPSSGCRFHTRCPVGPLFRPDRAVCREVDPQAAAAQHGGVACHFAGVAAEEIKHDLGPQPVT